MVWSERHYRDHMQPIFDALPEFLRGNVLTRAEPGCAVRPPMGRVALVAGYQDVNPLRSQCPMIYVEHGAGQTYADASHDPAYSGSGGYLHTGVIGFISPNELVAQRWKSAPAVAVGCPKMDQWRNTPAPTEPAICFTWHWEGTIVPETRSAFAHYEAHLAEIVAHYRLMGFRVYGHEHPKWRGVINRVWEQHGVEVLHSDVEVFTKASILMVDNSSLAYEFASLGRPVVSLNAPWYRRDVEHGQRFWQYVPGIEINFPEELMSLNPWDLIHDTTIGKLGKFLGQQATDFTYAKPGNGQTSSEFAAQWITDLLAEV